jgi:phage FluMu protein Com
MLEFRPVRCPECNTVVMDAAFTGQVRPLCPGCKRRVWAISDGSEIRIFMVTRRPKTLARAS